MVTYPWSFPARYRREPTAAGSKKNLELVVAGGPLPFGIEVKAPSLLDHIDKRGKNQTQVPSRAMPQQAIVTLMASEFAQQDLVRITTV